MRLSRTPSQTVGPYLALAMQWPADGVYVVPDGTPGAIWIRGRVLDAEASPVADAVVETWQADVDGRFPGSGSREFRGFGRCMTDSIGRWAVHTVKPGPVPDDRGELAAPFIGVAVFARGLLKPVWTRLYFGDEAAANDLDDVFRSVEGPRRASLIAVPMDDGYRLDIRLRGPEETVFFDV